MTITVWKTPVTPWPLFCFIETYLTKPQLWLDALEKNIQSGCPPSISKCDCSLQKGLWLMLPLNYTIFYFINHPTFLYNYFIICLLFLNPNTSSSVVILSEWPYFPFYSENRSNQKTYNSHHHIDIPFVWYHVSIFCHSLARMNCLCLYPRPT